MKITLAVHGRFHAFDLAAALLRRNVDVRLLTNLPRSRVAQWFPRERTRSLLMHGALARGAHALAKGEPPQLMEAALKRLFGRWAAGQQRSYAPDVAHTWSGVAEESLRARVGRICTLERSSAHIVAQDDLLAEEEQRIGSRLERPRSWIIARELREYDLADRIVVPSDFARRSFLEQGFNEQKVVVVRLTTRATGFVATKAAIAERVRRLRSGKPLRVLYVGTISYRKGMHDLRTVLEQLYKRMEFRLVGRALPECFELLEDVAHMTVIEPAVPQASLPSIYEWGDVFILPSIEDGFPVVMAQAQAAGLPILTSPHCGGPDIIAEGGQGWTVPARDAAATIEQLEWCDQHRDEVAAMVERLHEAPPQRGWDEVARDFVNAVT